MAARQIKAKKPIAWKKLCTWESLPELRRLLDKLPPTQPSQTAGKAATIAEITEVFDTPIEGVLVYNNSKIENVRDKVWLLLNRLLKCRHYTAQFDSLCERIQVTDGSTLAPVWEFEPNNEDESCGWGRLSTLLRETRKLFRANGILWTVSENQTLRTVCLKPLPFGDNGRSRQKSIGGQGGQANQTEASSKKAK